jgi:uncharacterized membrane-anchored protein YjiN (DUF445 family)
VSAPSLPNLSVGTATDADRLRALRRMKAVALGLLAFAAVIYVLTLDRGGAWTYVHATAEAAMVGAIADWFAVTALFRHPLGLPIPHTALIPTRKRLLGRSLQEFVTENFLSEQVVRQRVAGAQVGQRLGGWLREPANSERVVQAAGRMLRDGLTRVRDDDVALLVTEELLPRLAEEPLSEVSGRLLEEVVRDGAHHGLVDMALAEAHRWLERNADTVAELVAERAPWWTPVWVDEQVSRRIHVEALAWVGDIRDDQAHPARIAIDRLLGELATDLQHNPDTMARAERLKRRLLESPQVVSTAISVWIAVRRALVTTLDNPDSALHTRAADELSDFGRRLCSDDELRARVDGWAGDFAAYIVTTYGTEMATVISDTVERWDGDEAARRIELHVGRDLQFIRINGTLVGGLAGLLIHTASQLG